MIQTEVISTNDNKYVGTPVIFLTLSV